VIRTTAEAVRPTVARREQPDGANVSPLPKELRRRTCVEDGRETYLLLSRGSELPKTCSERRRIDTALGRVSRAEAREASWQADSASYAEAYHRSEPRRERPTPSEEGRCVARRRRSARHREQDGTSVPKDSAASLESWV
jgi:hypothetical protein